MAAFKLSTLLVLFGTLIVTIQNTQTASTTNGKLLKFYPITKEQYKSIMQLANQNSVISEGRLMESHRSLADWSDTLHRSWTNLFNYTKPDNEVLKGYPICVIKGDDYRERRKRGARQNEYDSYAGLAPTVVYSSSAYDPHYERPEYGRPPHHRPPYGKPPYEGEEDEEEPNTTHPEEPETGENAPIVNCVVIVKRKNKTTTRPHITKPDPEEEEEEYHKPHPYPPHPYSPYYPPPYGYPTYDPSKPMSPVGQYPPPPPYYMYPSHYEHEPKSSNNNIQSEYSSFDPAAEAHYQKTLNEYYNHLYRFYLADASTHVYRQDEINTVEPQYDDDEDDDDEESNDQYENKSEQMQLEKANLDDKVF